MFAGCLMRGMQIHPDSRLFAVRQRKVLPFGGFIPRGTPVNPCPAGKIHGKGHRDNNPDSPGPEHARGQLRAEPVTAQIRGYCLLINLLIMFCFNPRAWRRCGNVRRLFMPRVAGGVTKASVPQVSPGPAGSELLPLSLSPPTGLALSPCLSFPHGSWEYLDSPPPPAPVTASVPAVTSTVTGAGHVAVLTAVDSKLALNVPSGATAGFGVIPEPPARCSHTQGGAGAGCCPCVSVGLSQR